MQVPHKDVQFDIESCLHIDAVDTWYIHLEPTSEMPDRNLHLGYNLIPKDIVAQYAEVDDFKTDRPPGHTP